MNFNQIWQKIQNELYPGLKVRNWTAFRGYLGEDFLVKDVGQNLVNVEAPGAQMVQSIPRADFEYVFEKWNAYCAHKVQRQEIRNNTRYSKYVISILKHSWIQL